MDFREYIIAAIESLRQHRMRALLTMLGIIVGVFTVMLTLSIGAGARLAIEEQINSLGSNLIVLNSGPPPSQGHQAIYLYPADAHAILETVPKSSAVAPQQETRLPVQFGSVQLSSNFVMGVTASYTSVRGADLLNGRFILPKDDDQIAKVAVLGSAVEQYLFGMNDAVGRRILINNVDFEVVGALKPKGDSLGLGPGMSTDDRIFIPLSALQKRLLGTTDLRLIAVAARTQADIPAVAEAIRKLMDIANIMLVSVTERTREIGIRRALGATRRNVQRQFLIESIVLSGLGGGTGVLLGTTVPLAIGFALHWHVPILPQGIMLAFSAATLVGIISGLYPARRASKLDIVEALRFE